LAAQWSDDGQVAQLVQTIAPFAWVAHIDGKARATIHHFADILAADQTTHYRLRLRNA